MQPVNSLHCGEQLGVGWNQVSKDELEASIVKLGKNIQSLGVST